MCIRTYIYSIWVFFFCVIFFGKFMRITCFTRVKWKQLKHFAPRDRSNLWRLKLSVASVVFRSAVWRQGEAFSHPLELFSSYSCLLNSFGKRRWRNLATREAVRTMLNVVAPIGLSWNDLYGRSHRRLPLSVWFSNFTILKHKNDIHIPEFTPECCRISIFFLSVEQRFRYIIARLSYYRESLVGCTIWYIW